MHHRLRYNNSIALKAFFYGDDITEDEKKTARGLVLANSANLGAKLARCIRKGVDLKSDFISPAFPRRLYILAAQIGWRQQIRRNGLKVRDLGKRIL